MFQQRSLNFWAQCRCSTHRPWSIKKFPSKVRFLSVCGRHHVPSSSHESSRSGPTIGKWCDQKRSVRTRLRHRSNCPAFVTGNAKKLEEVKHILTQGNLTIPFKSQALDCNPTPWKRSANNEWTRCRARHQKSQFISVNKLLRLYWAIVNALMLGWWASDNGGYGTRISCSGGTSRTIHVHTCPFLFWCFRKWFLTEIGHVGLNNLLAAYTDKSADAICTFAYSAGPDAEVKLFEGVCVVCSLRVTS